MLDRSPNPWRTIALTLAAFTIGAQLGPSAGAGDQRIEAREFVLLDQAGQHVASLTCNEYGDPGLALVGRNKTTVCLTTSEDSASLRLEGKDGESCASLMAGDNMSGVAAGTNSHPAQILCSWQKAYGGKLLWTDLSGTLHGAQEH